jgi:hypothetical protein
MQRPVRARDLGDHAVSGLARRARSWLPWTITFPYMNEWIMQMKVLRYGLGVRVRCPEDRCSSGLA